MHDDARLWDALKRAYLVEEGRPYSTADADDDSDTLSGGGGGGGSRTPTGRFTLDSVVEDEGGNLSVGQVRLLSSLVLSSAVEGD